jgi:hypothetical protein
MTFDFSRISPRGWAVTIVISGSLISVPFMRANHVPGLRQSQESEFLSGASASQSTPDQPERLDGRSTSLATPTRVSAFRLPPPGAVPSPTVADSSQAVTTEFPEWVRKPSPLDELLHSSEPGQSTEATAPPLRKPTAFRTWSDETKNLRQVAEIERDSLRRHTPFSDSNPSSTAASPSLAHLVWPDQDLPQFADRPSRPAAELVGSRSSTELAGPNRHQFNSSPHGDGIQASKNVGASLRSQVVPSRELFIHQPGFGKP